MARIELPLEQVRHIRSAGFGVSRGHLHPDRILPEHDLLYVQQGQWHVQEEGSVYDIQPGDIALLFAGRHHFSLQPCLPGSEWGWIHFEAKPGDRFLAENASPPTSNETDMIARFPAFVSIGENRGITELFDRIIRAHRSARPNNRKQAQILLMELLLELSDLGHAQVASTASYVERVVRHIEWHPERTDSLDELADLASVSRRLLTREFRRATGQSIRQYQLEFKIRLAKTHLLHSPGIGINELASILGFSDQFHFSKCFKKLTGQSPSSFRQTRKS